MGYVQPFKAQLIYTFYNDVSTALLTSYPIFPIASNPMKLNIVNAYIVMHSIGQVTRFDIISTVNESNALTNVSTNKKTLPFINVRFEKDFNLWTGDYFLQPSGGVSGIVLAGTTLYYQLL